MNRLLAIAGMAVLWIGAVGCANDVNGTPGSPAVYQGIEASTDCVWLQQSFDRAADNNERAPNNSAEWDWTYGYMTTADDRMREVGCYG